MRGSSTGMWSAPRVNRARSLRCSPRTWKQERQILEIGTGAGWDALALEQAGYRVDRTDGATGFVDRLHKLGFPARVLNVLHDDLGGPYDAIYASAVLLHFSPTELRQVLTAALNATRPGDLLAATLKKGDGDEWSERKMEAPRYFHYWREPHLADLLTASGWETTYLDETTPADAHERWITVLARRPVDLGRAPR